jgi:hypothetical protein
VKIPATTIEALTIFLITSVLCTYDPSIEKIVIIFSPSTMKRYSNLLYTRFQNYVKTPRRIPYIIPVVDDGTDYEFHLGNSNALFIYESSNSAPSNTENEDNFKMLITDKWASDSFIVPKCSLGEKIKTCENTTCTISTRIDCIHMIKNHIGKLPSSEFKISVRSTRPPHFNSKRIPMKIVFDDPRRDYCDLTLTKSIQNETITVFQNYALIDTFRYSEVVYLYLNDIYIYKIFPYKYELVKLIDIDEDNEILKLKRQDGSILYIERNIVDVLPKRRSELSNCISDVVSVDGIRKPLCNMKILQFPLLLATITVDDLILFHLNFTTQPHCILDDSCFDKDISLHTAYELMKLIISGMVVVDAIDNNMSLDYDSTMKDNNGIYPPTNVIYNGKSSQYDLNRHISKNISVPYMCFNYLNNINGVLYL